MEADGIIVKEEGHTSWVLSMLVIDKRRTRDDPRKKDPLSKRHIRICIDPWDLNKALKTVHHPVVTIGQVADCLSIAEVFTSLDACSGFWQLPMDEESSKL